MNPNDMPMDTGPEQDQAPLDEAESMNTVDMSTTEYPALEGLADGDQVKLSCTGTVKASDEGTITLELSNCDVQTQNRADKELKQMTGDGNKGVYADNSPVNGGEF